MRSERNKAYFARHARVDWRVSEGKQGWQVAGFDDRQAPTRRDEQVTGYQLNLT